MTVVFTAKLMRPVAGVRRADKATNRMSFSGVLPWYDLDNLMGPQVRDGSSFEGILEAESLLEHDFVLVQRLDRTIRQQPCRLKWWDSRTSEWRIHVPDFEIRHQDAPRLTYVQVKFAEDAEALEEDLRLIGEAMMRLGHAFEVWTEAEIRRQPRFRNAQILYSQTGPLENVAALDAVRAVVRAAAPRALTIGEIREAAGVGGDAFRAVLRLHVRGEVALDLDQPIGDGALAVPVVATRRQPAAAAR